MGSIKKSFFLFLCGLFFPLLSYGGMAIQVHADDKPIVIYTSADANVKEYTEKLLKENFPQYEIIIEYMTTGNHAAKLKTEGLNTPCDITFDLDFDYLKLNEDLLATLPYDFSLYVADVIPASRKYACTQRAGSSIFVNPEILKEKGVAIPVTYADLLKPEYKNLISMASPKTSGTAYGCLKSLVNAWGEDKTFEYFDSLSENILQFTSSGSGPVKALVLGEVAIGFGMISHAVTEINKGANLQLVQLDVGAPYALYGFGIIKGKEKRKSVMEVANFIYDELIDKRAQLYYPESLYVDKMYTLPNYPTDIVYADISGGGFEERQRLLDRWEY